MCVLEKEVHGVKTDEYGPNVSVFALFPWASLYEITSHRWSGRTTCVELQKEAVKTKQKEDLWMELRLGEQWT